MLNHTYNHNSPRWYNGLQMQLRALLALLIFMLLVSHIQCSADYGESSDFQHNSDGNSEASNDNDEIYETSLLQQEMHDSELRKKLMEAAATAMPELHDDMEMKSRTAMPKPKTSKEFDAHAQSPHAMLDNESVELNTAHNSVNMQSPKLMSATTMIPTYVRQGKAEQYPRTISGAIVSAEEADANVSLSDYVEDEEVKHHQQHFEQRQLQLPVNANKVHTDDSNVPVAMKYYQNTGKDILEADDNNLQNQQPSLPLPHQQLLPDAQQRQPFQANNSDEDYYEDSRGSMENHHNIPQQQTPVSRTIATPAAAPAIAAAAVAPAQTPKPTYEPPHVAVAQADLPTLTPIAFNPVWLTTNTPPLAPFTTAPSTAAVNVQTGETSIDKPAGVTATAPPAVAVRTATVATPAVPATGPAPESAAPLLPTAVASTPAPAQVAIAALPANTGAAVATTTATAATTTTATLLTPTTTRPAGSKQGKQINLRRRLLPHEQLRNYIEDAYIRMPLAVIVDPSSGVLEKTKTLWREALRTNLNIKIVLVSLNASGIPAAFSFNNTRQFLAGLNSIKEHDGGNSFIGIVHASELVPYDSAVFISTAMIPPHTELVQDAAITLLKKRIRLYLIWYGERAVSENETQEAVGGILGEVAIRSGGEILHIVGSENSQELEGSTLTIVADAFRGTQEVDIPVDTTLSSLHVKIDMPMRTATLETPNGG